jgi:hypothetical protein
MVLYMMNRDFSDSWNMRHVLGHCVDSRSLFYHCVESVD